MIMFQLLSPGYFTYWNGEGFHYLLTRGAMIDPKYRQDIPVDLLKMAKCWH